MAPSGGNQLLSINAGSTSIKFALYRQAPNAEPVLSGAIENIGQVHSRFRVAGAAGDTFERRFAIPETVTAVSVLVDWLIERLPPSALAAVVHRVVGVAGPATTERISTPMLARLYSAMHCNPGHLPQEIRLIETMRRHFPGAAHLACYDSGFHTDMPDVARRLPIPRAYDALGIRRVGFHGLSCAWLLRALAATAGPAAADGKVVIAHLGGGASVTAVERGRSRDTSMGLTPAGGIMMGTRSGDLDPGLAWHLARSEKLSQADFQHMINHQSGLLGVSGRSADIRVLLEQEGHDSAAAQAVDMFCYQARKSICAMAGAIDGIETLIFAGGVGEHASAVRLRICTGLRHLGLALDPMRNLAGAGVISTDASRVSVRVMHSDEQCMMAEEARLWLTSAAATTGEDTGHD